MKKWCNCTQKQKVERWENVLRVLRKLTPHQRKKHFNMSFWLDKTECGTIGCAAGHCSLDPWFRRRGFSGKFTRDSRDNLWDFSWADSNSGPREFFGDYGYSNIFVNQKFAGVDRYRDVVLAVKDYIKELRNDEAI